MQQLSNRQLLEKDQHVPSTYIDPLTKSFLLSGRFKVKTLTVFPKRIWESLKTVCV